MKGEILHKKYTIIEVIGQDSCSETFLAKGKGIDSWRRCAIKKFRPILGNSKATSIKNLFYQEASILRLLSGHHPQIPQLYECFMDGEDFYLVREWIEGITLKQKVKQQGKLPEQEVKQILSSILSILQYIHKYGIVYRELNPNSIVLRRNHWVNRVKNQEYLPVPIYFGRVKELTSKSQKSNQLSLALTNHREYISPEQEQGNSIYVSDLYSLGLTAIYLLTAKNPAELGINPYTNQLLWEREAPNLSTNLTRVINRAICAEPSDRFTDAEAMFKALNTQSVNLNESLFTRSESKSTVKSLLSSEIKVVSLLSSMGLGVIGVAFAILNLDFSQLETALGDRQLSSKAQLESLFLDLNNPFKDKPQATLSIPAFPVGTPQSEVTNVLGAPTQSGLGYGGESQVLFYQDFVPQKVDLGYLYDWQTQTIRQTEISFANSVQPVEIEASLEQLLATQYSPEIAQQVSKVVSGESKQQVFAVSNLQGVIQRTPQNRIHVAVWDHSLYQ